MRERYRCSIAHRAFTFVEVMVVIVVIGILAAIVVPRFGGMTDDAKAVSVQSTLSGVRASVAAYRSRAILSGNEPFPTLDQLTAVGTVVQQGIPANPFNESAVVQSVSRSQAEARVVAGSAGWNYFVDNDSEPPVAVFYANSENPTTVTDANGVSRGANDL